MPAGSGGYLGIQPFPVAPPTQNAENLGPENCNCVGSTGGSSAGEPIDIASGNMSYEVNDYKTMGQNPLSFTRYYNSRGNAAGIVTLAGTMGTNWRSTFDRFIQINSSSQVTAERAGGQQYIFNLVGSTWTPNADVDITLTHSGSTWTLTDHDDTVETYTTTGSGTSALLNTIQSRNGYTQTLHRNGSNQITSVTRQLQPRAQLYLQWQRHHRHDRHTRQHHPYLRLQHSHRRHPADLHQLFDFSGLEPAIFLHPGRTPLRPHRHHRRKRQQLRHLDL